MFDALGQRLDLNLGGLIDFFCRRLLQMGVTTCEVKSGYGLDLDTELKMLRAVAKLQSLQPIELVMRPVGDRDVVIAGMGEEVDDHGTDLAAPDHCHFFHDRSLRVTLRALMCSGCGHFAMANPPICRDNSVSFHIGLVDMPNLDKLDHLLVAKLREDARAPVAELARALGASRTTIQSRIARLERLKVITGYSVRVAESFEKDQIHAYVMITVGPKKAATVSADIKRMPAVRLLQSVSGVFDMIALAVAPSVKEMDDLIDAIGNLDGVERTTSSVVLSTKFDR